MADTILNPIAVEPDSRIGLLAEHLASLPSPIAAPRSEHAGGRPIAVVLGMHRSGTSLLSQILHYLGVAMADETDRASASNPGGFWERPAIVDFHEDVLRTIGRPLSSFDHHLPFPAGWWRQTAVQSIKKKMRTYLERELSDTPGWWGFKDPRTCRLLPLWWELFDELRLVPHYIWAVRSPVETAVSMALKNPRSRPMTPMQAEIAWLAYNYDILRGIGNGRFALVDYREWFSDAAAVARRLMDHLNLSGFATDYELTECLNRLVRPEWQHQVEGPELELRPSLLAASFYRELTSAARAPHRSGRMGGFVMMLEIAFRMIAPFAGDMSELKEARERLHRFDEVAAAIQRLPIVEDVAPGHSLDPAEAAARIERFADALKTLSAECETTRQERTQLASQVEQLLTELAQATETRSTQRGEFEKLQSELARTVEAGSKQRAELEKRNGELKAAATDATRKCEALQAELAAGRTAIDESRQQAERLERLLQTERTVATALRAEAAEARQRLAQMEASLAEAKQLHDETVAKLGTERDTTQRLEAAAAQAKQEYEAARVDLRKTQQAVAQERERNAGLETALTAERAALETQRVEMDRRNGMLKAANSEITLRYEASKLELETVTAALDVERSRGNDLEADVATQKERLAVTERQRAELERRVDHLQAAAAEQAHLHETASAAARKALENERGRGDGLAAEIETQKSRLATIEEQYAELEQRNDHLRTESAELARRHEITVEELAAAREALETERGRGDGLEAEIETQKNRLTAVEEQYAELKRRNDHLLTESAELARRHETSVEELAAAREALATERGRGDGLEAEIETQKTRLATTQEEYAELARRYDHLRTESTELARRHETTIEELAAAREALETERGRGDSLEAEIATQKDRLATVEEQYAELERRNDHLRAEAAELARLHETSVEELAAAREALETERDRAEALVSEVGAGRNALADAGARVWELERRVDDLGSKAARAAQRADQAEGELAELHELLETERAGACARQSDLKRQVDAAEAVSEQLDATLIELAEARKVLAEQQARADRLETAIQAERDEAGARLLALQSEAERHVLEQKNLAEQAVVRHEVAQRELEGVQAALAEERARAERLETAVRTERNEAGAKLTEARAESERRNRQIQAEYDAVRARLAEIEHSTEAELAALRAERDELVAARAEQQTSIKQLQRSIAKATAEREQAVNQVLDERDALQRMLAVERDKLAWIQGEVEADRSRMRNLEIACSGYVARINALKHAAP